MNSHNPALSRFGGVSVRLSVELGRTEMSLREVLALGEGSVVALNRLTDELLDVTANGRVIARGEVVAEDGRFALRIVSLAGEEGDDLPGPPVDAVSPGPFDNAAGTAGLGEPRPAEPPAGPLGDVAQDGGAGA
ncbi:FliM/FliN family flagellar motor switch protein [Erythrobacter sp.]|uniref:FliM/FliN family flagellar motor switch protein n=1 Tax=Erythrobacter sp. TaxID=1042 RepID=UPI001425F955|nr:FliM/FliN family flagellar motor switch protein [Erythrobacter sp.]QIQ87126.1 MAG: flagellar motor switch protein FliN [Erythrobacter sp.]